MTDHGRTPPKHPKYLTVLRLYHYGEYPDNKPIKAWKTLARISGVSVPTLKDWHAKGFMDLDPAKMQSHPGAQEQEPTDNPGTAGKRKYVLYDGDAVNPDEEDGEEEGESENRLRGFEADPLLASLALPPEALPDSGDDYRESGRAGRGWAAIREETTVAADSIPPAFSVGFYVRAPGFYADPARWAADEATAARRMASLCRAQAEALARAGAGGTTAFKALSNEARRMSALALELQAKAPAVGLETAAKVRSEANSTRDKLRRRQEAQRAQYEKSKL